MIDGKNPSWGLASGVPSLHILQSALRTAHLIDSKGSTRRAARDAYLGDPSEGIFNHQDLRRGEDLLIDTGLVEERADVLYPTTELNDLVHSDPLDAHLALVALALTRVSPPWLLETVPIFSALPDGARTVLEELVPDPERREAFLIAVASDTMSDRSRLGEMGEKLVVEVARDELLGFGRPELADRVRRVSLYTDTLGYDVTAPLIAGGSRRLEVKTTRREVNEACVFYVSRNEIDVGLRDGSWALVVCREELGTVQIVGWCRGPTLAPYLPADSVASYWTEVRLVVPRHVFLGGIPPAI